MARPCRNASAFTTSSGRRRAGAISLCRSIGPQSSTGVVASADPQNSEIILAFITSVLTNHSPRAAEVQLTRSDPEFRSTGLKADSLIRLDNVTLSSGLISRRLGTVGPVTKDKVFSMLRRAFDLK